MKLTLSNVKELKRASTNPLTKHVCKQLLPRHLSFIALFFYRRISSLKR